MSDAARRLTVVGELGGEYVVDEELADGRLVIRPATSAVAMNRRLHVEPITGEEFRTFLGEHGENMLPADD